MNETTEAQAIRNVAAAEIENRYPARSFSRPASVFPDVPFTGARQNSRPLTAVTAIPEKKAICIGRRGSAARSPLKPPDSRPNRLPQQEVMTSGFTPAK